MKVIELVEKMKDAKVVNLKPEQFKIKLQKDIEVKKYLSVEKKRNIIERIINDSLLYEDGIYKFDEIDKYISLIMRCVEAYTNIELSDDIQSDYDILCENELLGKIIELFDDEYQSIMAFLQMRCGYILSNNRIEAQIAKFLEGVSDKLDGVVDALKYGVENFDLSKLNITKEDMSKLNEVLAMFKQ